MSRSARALAFSIAARDVLLHVAIAGLRSWRAGSAALADIVKLVVGLLEHLAADD